MIAGKNCPPNHTMKIGNYSYRNVWLAEFIWKVKISRTMVALCHPKVFSLIFQRLTGHFSHDPGPNRVSAKVGALRAESICSTRIF